jgi:hypothetical protein
MAKEAEPTRRVASWQRSSFLWQGLSWPSRETCSTPTPRLSGGDLCRDDRAVHGLIITTCFASLRRGRSIVGLDGPAVGWSPQCWPAPLSFRWSDFVGRTGTFRGATLLAMLSLVDAHVALAYADRHRHRHLFYVVFAKCSRALRKALPVTGGGLMGDAAVPHHPRPFLAAGRRQCGFFLYLGQFSATP